jgi:Asp-tRNA(Asn)/Glu-tRNA(Gln) amidotransferase A subunit family amidase
VRIPSDFKDIKGWQVALSIDLDVFEVDREVEKNTREAARALQEAGARVEEVQLGWSQAIKRNLWTHLGVIMGPYIRRYFEQAPDLVSDYVREFVQRTSSIGTDDLLASLVLEGEMYEKLGNLFRRFRLLICPTLAVPSVPAEHNVRNSGFTINGKPVDANLDWCLTYPFNMMSRCPVLSVPSGFAPGNLPTGLQIVGRPFDDAAVFRAGAALERARPWFDSPDRRPRL